MWTRACFCASRASCASSTLTGFCYSVKSPSATSRWSMSGSSTSSGLVSSRASSFLVFLPRLLPKVLPSLRPCSLRVVSGYFCPTFVRSVTSLWPRWPLHSSRFSRASSFFPQTTPSKIVLGCIVPPSVKSYSHRAFVRPVTAVLFLFPSAFVAQTHPFVISPPFSRTMCHGHTSFLWCLDRPYNSDRPLVF